MLSVTETLKRLNWTNGRGNVTGIRYDDTRKAGTVTRRIPVTQHTGFNETRRFRIVGNQVHAFGSSRTRKETT